MRRPAAGTGLLLLLVLIWYMYIYGRTLLHDEGPPAFFVDEPKGVRIYLANGFSEPGIHQFSDAPTLASVITMTLDEAYCSIPSELQVALPMYDGEAIDVVCSDSQLVEFKRYWMPAFQRLALGIPLHPDRMTRDDWESLPGIGPKLAKRIVEDRQENGDFGTLGALDRVRGIGSKKIDGWKKYFQ